MRSHPFRFFFWVLLLSTPLYIWGVFWPVHGLPLGLPATAVMIFLPAAVATIQARREQGAESARDLWRGVLDVSRIKSPGWFWAAFLWMPAVSILAYAFMLLWHIKLPLAPEISLSWAPAIFALFFLGAIFEEIGWTAYATEPLQRQFGILGAGSIIGAVWAVWHAVPWWQGEGHPLWWVAGEAALTVELRIVMGWIYAKGGRSLFLAILFHAMITAYSLLPNGGSHYNPAFTAAGVLLMAGLTPQLRRIILKCL